MFSDGIDSFSYDNNIGNRDGDLIVDVEVDFFEMVEVEYDDDNNDEDVVDNSEGIDEFFVLELFEVIFF